MAVRQLNTDTFEVDSSSNGGTYIVMWGSDGPWFSCNCMAFVMKRNRYAGSGCPGTCKHIDQVTAQFPRTTTSAPSSTPGASVKRYFEFIGGTSRKFWEIEHIPGRSHFTVRFGPIGANGQTQQKTFANDRAATIAAGKIINEKVNKGYVEKSASGLAPLVAPAAPVAQPAAPATPAAPKLVPMLADEVDMDEIGAFCSDGRYVFEAKLDGHRVMIKIENGTATAIGRNGQASQHAPRFKTGKHKKDLDRLGNRTLVLDGELMQETGVFWIFDMPSFVGGGGAALTFGYDEPWSIRRKALQLVFDAWQPDPSCYRLLPFAATTEDKVALVENQKANQGEGVIIKLTSAHYRPGIRCRDTMKAKFVHDADLIVTKVGVDGKNNAVLSVFRDGGLVEVGKCSLNGKASVQIGDVVVVRYLYLGAGDRIVQPRLMSVRHDKPHIQCTFDQLIGTNKAAHQ